MLCLLVLGRRMDRARPNLVGETCERDGMVSEVLVEQVGCMVCR